MAYFLARRIYSGPEGRSHYNLVLVGVILDSPLEHFFLLKNLKMWGKLKNYVPIKLRQHTIGLACFVHSVAEYFGVQEKRSGRIHRCQLYC